MSCVRTPSFRWIKGVNSAGANVGSIDVPAGGVINPGDRLIIIAVAASTAGTEAWDPVPGWTILLEGGIIGPTNSHSKLLIITKVAEADGTEESVTVGFTTNVRHGAAYFCVDGPTAAPVLGTEVVNDNATPVTVFDFAASSTARDRDLLLAILSTDNGPVNNAAVFPAPWTPVYEDQDDSVISPMLSVASYESDPTTFEGQSLAAFTVTLAGAATGCTVTLRLPARVGRSTHEVLTELLKFLPPEYVEATDLLGALAAQMSRVGSDGGTLFDLATVARGVDKWLTLHGRGLGVLRGPGESDDAYRQRLRSVEDRVTRPAIMAAVESILESRQSGPNTDGQMIEWFEGPALGLEPFYLGTLGAALSPGPNSFIVAVEDFDNDNLFDEATYNSVANALNELRAAGVRAYMAMAVGVMTGIPNRRGVLGWPLLLTTGDITSADRDGFDVFSATDYGKLDVGRLALNNVKMFALKFRLTAAPATAQPFIGSSGATGIALWLTPTGALELRIADGVTTVTITLAAAMPIEVGTDWWVFLQMDQRASGSAVPGLVAIGRAGDVNVTASQTFTPAAGVQHNAFAVETRIGRNDGALGPGAVSLNAVKILEIREYDAEADTSFSFTVPVVDLILADVNKRWDRIDLQYDGSDQVLF